MAKKKSGKREGSGLNFSRPLTPCASFLAEYHYEYIEDWFYNKERELRDPSLKEEMGGSVVEYLLRKFEKEARNILKKHGHSEVKDWKAAYNFLLYDKAFCSTVEPLDAACHVLRQANNVRGYLSENESNPEGAATSMFLLCAAILRAGGMEAFAVEGNRIIENRIKPRKKALQGIILAVHQVLDKHGDDLTRNQIWEKLENENLKLPVPGGLESYEVFVEEGEDIINQIVTNLKNNGNTRTKSIKKRSFYGYVTEIKKVRKKRRAVNK